MTGNSVDFVVRRHKSGHVGILDSRNKRRQEDFTQLALGKVHRCRIDPAKGFSTGNQVFCASQDMILAIDAVATLEAPDQVLSHFRHQQRILAVGLAHAAPTGIAGHVQIRREGPVHPGPTHLLRSFGPNLLHHRGIEGRGHVDIRRINGASLVEGIPMNRIHAQQQRNPQAALRSDALQAGRLFTGKDVKERAHLPFPDLFRHIRMAEVLIGRIHVPMRGTLSRRNVARAYILAHLPDFFFERHLRQQGFRTGRRRERSIAVIGCRTGSQQQGGAPEKYLFHTLRI